MKMSFLIFPLLAISLNVYADDNIPEDADDSGQPTTETETPDAPASGTPAK
jgi:hypothetical protein